MGLIYVVIAIASIAGLVFLFLNRNKGSESEIKINNKPLKSKYELDCKELSERYRAGISDIPKSEHKSYLEKFKKERALLTENYKLDLKGSRQPGNVQKESEVKSNTLPVEARIYDNILGTIYNNTISGATVDKILSSGDGTLGRKWLYNGKWMFALNRKYNKDSGDISFEPIIVPATMDNPPSRLRRALSHPYVAITWNTRKPDSFLHKYGVYLLFAAFVAFLMFMLIAQ
jgi:hypothetical protein